MDKIVIVLAMHGTPPLDYPPQDAAELFNLHGRLEHASDTERDALEKRYVELEARMRSWPRTAENDPFYTGSQKLAHELEKATDWPVIIGFNEYCAPDLNQALDTAAAYSPARIVVVTPMMTRGGHHSEKDIPETVERARQRYTGCEIIYAWPFPTGEIAHFLKEQVERFGE